MLFRVIGFIVGVFLISSAAAFSILKKEVVQEKSRPEMPAYYKWIIGWSYWLIAVGLIIALYKLLKTFTTYLNSKKLKKLTSELQTSLRRYLIIFTISYICVSLLAVIGYYNNWQLYIDPKQWPFSVQIAEFALEVGYDVLAIWLLV